LAFGQVKVVSSGKVGINQPIPLEFLHVGGNLALENLSESGNLNKRNHIIYGVGNKKRLQVSTASSTAASSSFFQMFGDETNNAPQPERAGEFLMSGKYIKMVVNKPIGAFGTTAFEIKENSDLYAYTANAFKQGSSSWTVISDKNLKSNIKEYQGGLQEILKIRPVHFNYNGKGGTLSGEDFVGVIAQEFQKVSPNSIKPYVYEDLEKTVKEEYLGVDDSVIKYMLVNAVQEQNQMIEKQENKINRLESELNKLKEHLNTLISEGISGAHQTNVVLEASDLAELSQNIPNPFNGNTTIDYNIPLKSNDAKILIFNNVGKLIKTVSIDHLGKGTLNVRADNIPSGTYIYHLEVDNKIIDAKKMVVE